MDKAARKGHMKVVELKRRRRKTKRWRRQKLKLLSVEDQSSPLRVSQLGHPSPPLSLPLSPHLSLSLSSLYFSAFPNSLSFQILILKTYTVPLVYFSCHSKSISF